MTHVYLYFSLLTDNEYFEVRFAEVAVTHVYLYFSLLTDNEYFEVRFKEVAVTHVLGGAIARLVVEPHRALEPEKCNDRVCLALAVDLLHIHVAAGEGDCFNERFASRHVTRQVDSLVH